jgi:hypothetical protein
VVARPHPSRVDPYDLEPDDVGRRQPASDHHNSATYADDRSSDDYDGPRTDHDDDVDPVDDHHGGSSLRSSQVASSQRFLPRP